MKYEEVKLTDLSEAANLVAEGNLSALPVLIHTASYYKKCIDKTVKEAIRDIRNTKGASDGGVSWQEIADALGISRQAAWERYHD